MSPRYTLPDSIGNGSSNTLRTLLVWGLPVLAWGFIFLGLWFFNREEAPETPAAQPASAASEGQPQATPPAGQPAPAQQPGQSGVAAPQTATPAGQPQTVQTAAPAPIAPSAPYDFTGAAATVGLPKEANCATGILVDAASRKVLWAKGADKAVPIASMTKMMTLLLAEEAIAAQRVTRETVIPVSVAAYKIGGSQVWLDPRESFPLGELLKAVAIKSANDAAYLVGEYLGQGDIATFVKQMNERARQLGMTHTTFYEPHGLGDSQKRSNLASAHDMVLLGERLLGYPEVMRLTSTKRDSFRNGKTELKNHNNLVFQGVPGVDGLKTGYTAAAGYCVTISCQRGGRRLLACVTGFSSARDRDAFCKALLDWGYAR